ncbi:MAG: hypothetical protein DRP87_05545 [Spirochaetes bacterium]|nr:MAG: hypothetical protein DRP87_05545 [Spirochaetota bacterium]
MKETGTNENLELKQEARPGKKLGRNVVSLGMVSLFTDLSSQMVYPLVPTFLDLLGASPAILGLIEGIAESTASIFRTVFGFFSDKLKKRKHFITIGYGLSSVSRPFLYVAGSWATVLGVRFADRVGKAVRTPARNALISTSIDPSIRGKAFGFHRAMDRIGAIGGPLLAMLILSLLPYADSEPVRALKLTFLISVIPCVLALIFIRFARETKIEVKQKEKRRGLCSMLPLSSFLLPMCFYHWVTLPMHFSF